MIATIVRSAAHSSATGRRTSKRGAEARDRACAARASRRRRAGSTRASRSGRPRSRFSIVVSESDETEVLVDEAQLGVASRVRPPASHLDEPRDRRGGRRRGSSRASTCPTRSGRRWQRSRPRDLKRDVVERLQPGERLRDTAEAQKRDTRVPRSRAVVRLLTDRGDVQASVPPGCRQLFAPAHSFVKRAMKFG